MKVTKFIYLHLTFAMWNLVEGNKSHGEIFFRESSFSVSFWFSLRTKANFRRRFSLTPMPHKEIWPKVEILYWGININISLCFGFVQFPGIVRMRCSRIFTCQLIFYSYY